MGEIYLLSGEIQSGKTSLCLEVIEHARREEYRLGGVVSPAVFNDGEKIAIDLLDIRSEEQRRLADLLGERDSPIATQRWAFKPGTVDWGNQILKDAVPCDLLVIDELGPLEFFREEGWVQGFETIASGSFQSALLVIRPSLLEQAFERWDVERVIRIDDPDEGLRSGEKLYHHLVGRGTES
jgi:nucleoside-triphosphatase THEP1